jgi:TrmH family RNA methyltransferase
MDSLQDARSPQPVMLVVRRAAASVASVLAGRGGVPLVVIAWGVQDPGNLGGIVRSADAAGATGLIATGGSADLYHPRTVRATMGSIFRLPLTDGEGDDILDRVAAAGLVTIGAVPRGGTPYDAIDWRAPSALLLGGEGAGLPGELEARSGVRVGVPMRHGVESLSVGAAAAVLLFEAARSRRGASGAPVTRGG